jgi:hypothetical protein
MDISSINDGTVDTKGWLNPTVGTLRAKKIICDDIEGGGGGGGGPSALNSAVNPGVFVDTLTQGGFVGGAAGYGPVTRLIPTSDLYAPNSSFEFECSGTLLSDVAGTDNTSRPSFSIMVGDDYDDLTSNGQLGYTVLGINGLLFYEPLVWTYKLVATRVASATQGGLAFTWTSEVSFSKNNTSISVPAAGGVMSRIAMGKKDLGVVTPVGDGVRFSMYISNMDFNGDTMTIVKYNHTFQRVA